MGKLSLVFMPDNHDDSCGVYHVRSFLYNKVLGPSMDKSDINVIDMLVSGGRTHKKQTEHVFLFAHNHDFDTKAFLNAKGGSIKTAVTYTAWLAKHPGFKKFDFLFAHVCYGAFILNSDNWKSTFPHYIAFKHQVQMSEDYISEIIWSKIYRTIFNKMNSTGTTSINNRIKNVFIKMIDELEEGKNHKKYGEKERYFVELTISHLYECLAFWQYVKSN